eukprot:CAMPEP_0201593438 /NCGR_PEP_ID=MMETSP0190_2-20130828/191041_1 /ASSEMBLY_ACC=CAM_ASM_000263 /TAXON_ID=37353 /ORGANISM="Rosalina sp." /LENGTH=72 /DNA_ID=CAMNT_0048052621 /DNA_START=134 /DNA_END=352 /DNA_ORIENTATION=+
MEMDKEEEVVVDHIMEMVQDHIINNDQHKVKEEVLHLEDLKVKIIIIINIETNINSKLNEDHNIIQLKDSNL